MGGSASCAVIEPTPENSRCVAGTLGFVDICQGSASFRFDAHLPPGVGRDAPGCTILTMVKRVAVLPLLLLISSCGKDPSQQLAALSGEFVYGSLAFSPSTATAA